MKSFLTRRFIRALALIALFVAPASVWAQQATETVPLLGFAPVPPKPFRMARYRGTVGEQRVTVEISVEHDYSYDDSALTFTGTVRFDGQPTVLHRLHSWPDYRSTAPLQVVETDSANPHPIVGYWQTDQPAGPLLTGTWMGLTGEQRAFALREDYHDEWGKLAAVPYEIVSKDYVVTRDSVWNWPDFVARMTQGVFPNGAEPIGMYGQDYLHLLGADTLRAAIASIQCPPPAMRGTWARQQANEKLRHTIQNGYRDSPAEYRGVEEQYDNLYVTYADYGLLCLSADNSYCSGQAACSHGFANTVFDLNAGGILTLNDILRPGALVALRHVLARYLFKYEQTIFGEEGSPSTQNTSDKESDFGYDSNRIPLSEDYTFGLVENGLDFHYSDHELLFHRWGPDIIVPWNELLPLLRPDSAVARMLRERGLW